MRLFKKAKKQAKQTANIHFDLDELSPKEIESFYYFQHKAKEMKNVIRSQFNLEHWRKVKQARLAVK